jgi:hypothetical protein
MPAVERVLAVVSGGVAKAEHTLGMGEAGPMGTVKDKSVKPTSGAPL